MGQYYRGVILDSNEADFKVPDCYREWGCKIHHINTCRSPIDKGNINAISQIKKLVDKQKKYFQTRETFDLDFRISMLKKLKTSIKTHENDILQAPAAGIYIMDINGKRTKINIR